MSDGFYENLAVWSQVVASILFIIVLVIMWIKFIAPAVVASQTRKNNELLEAQARRDATRDEIDAAQREVSIAEDQARSILSRAQTDATRISEGIIAGARAEGERVAHNAEGELDRSRAAARDALRAEILDRALAIARGNATNLDSAADKRLVDETIATADRSGSSS